MELLSPRQAARALGVSESSLKRWCDRGLLTTTRTPGGHRKVSTAEVLRFVREHDHPLAVSSLLGVPGIGKRTEADLAQARPRLAAALLTGDEALARQIVFDLYLAKHPLSVICDEVIAGAFREIGQRWACNEADVYQERRGCEITLRIVHELRLKQAVADSAPLAIGATITGDHYVLPTTMAEMVLGEVGFRASLLGEAIPLRSLARAVRELKPRLFWLSLSHLDENLDFVAEFAAFSQACTDERTALVVGGRAFSDELRHRVKYAAYCDTMQQLESFARALLPGLTRRKRSRPERSTKRGAAAKKRSATTLSARGRR